MRNNVIKVIGLFSILWLISGQRVAAMENNSIFFIEPLPEQKGTLYADGRTVELHGEIVTWPMVGSDLSNITLGRFKEMVLASRRNFENDPYKIIVSPHGPDRGLNIVFSVSNPPPGALTAIDSIATYIESVFSDDITVTINVNFASMGPGVLGATSNYYAGVVTYSDSRTGLINDMDGDDSIQTYLPSGSTIPVRYVYGSSTVTNEDRCYFSRANYKAAIGTTPGVDASMTFNTDYPWDFDPRDGVIGVCFQTVAGHETGHVLGFVSGADFRTNDIEALDLYRFQNTDDGGDYNPDNLAEFQTLARLVDKDAGGVDDDVNSDLIDIEYRMSDGTPYQCSHFKQTTVFAIMQPAFSSGQTYYPHFYKNPDKRMFDAIGWDYLLSYTICFTVVGSGTVNTDPYQFTYTPGTPVEISAVPASGWSFVEWGGSLSGSQNPDTVIMDSDKQIYVNFLPTNCTLTVNIIGQGSVIRTPDLPYYPRDSLVILDAQPNPGWRFDHWSGSLWGSQNPDTIKMNTDKTVNAHFVEDQYVGDNSQNDCTLSGLAIYPNPSNGQFMIHGPDREDRRVDIAIYDISGKLIRSFALPDFNSWDGRDEKGETASTGIYFLKFKSSDAQGIRKLLLLR